MTRSSSLDVNELFMVRRRRCGTLGTIRVLFPPQNTKLSILFEKKQETHVFWVHSERPSDDEVDEEQILKMPMGQD